MTASPTTGPAETPTPAGSVHDTEWPDPVRDWAVDRAAKLRAMAAGADATADAPIYGSRSWQALPHGHPLRWVSALRAAEAWRHDSDPHVLAARLALEDDMQQQADRDDWAAVREDMTRVSRMLRPDQLAKRRALPVTPWGEAVG